MDLQAAAGRQVPQRQANDRRGRGRHLRPPGRSGDGSNALSVFTGILSKGGTRKVDDHTVEFHLDVGERQLPLLPCPPTTTTPSSCRRIIRATTRR